nr:MAG TPA_asm: hypothetical protein [Caudoviricetes sp.]
MSISFIFFTFCFYNYLYIYLCSFLITRCKYIYYLLNKKINH